MALELYSDTAAIVEARLLYSEVNLQYFIELVIKFYTNDPKAW